VLDKAEWWSNDLQRMKEWRDDCVTELVTEGEQKWRWWERIICENFGRAPWATELDPERLGVSFTTSDCCPLRIRISGGVDLSPSDATLTPALLEA